MLTFHMPFFFLLAGLLAVKTLHHPVLVIIKKKSRGLMVPFFTCGLSLSLLLSKLNDYVFTLMHNGYWFLLSLFTCWAIFLPIAKFVYNRWGGKGLFVEAIILALPFFIGNELMKLIPEKINDLFAFPLTFSMYRFFVVGYFLGRLFLKFDTEFEENKLEKQFYKDSFIRIIFPISVVVFTLYSICIIVSLPIIDYFPETISQLLLSVSLFFALYGIYTSIATSVNRIIQYVGRNTLPIYVFHFYIVYGFYYEPLLSHNYSYQAIWAFAISVFVIVITLALSIPFRKDKILRLLFLGKS